MIKERCEKGHAIARDQKCAVCERARRAIPTQRGEVLWLDAAPFVRWLRAQAKHEDLIPLATRLGIPVERARRLLNGHQRKVHIDTVDHALCRDGTTHLRALYPQLYNRALGRRGWRLDHGYSPED